MREENTSVSSNGGNFRNITLMTTSSIDIFFLFSFFRDDDEEEALKSDWRVQKSKGKFQGFLRKTCSFVYLNWKGLLVIERVRFKICLHCNDSFSIPFIFALFWRREIKTDRSKGESAHEEIKITWLKIECPSSQYDRRKDERISHWWERRPLESMNFHRKQEKLVSQMY